MKNKAVPPFLSVEQVWSDTMQCKLMKRLAVTRGRSCSGLLWCWSLSAEGWFSMQLLESQKAFFFFSFFQDVLNAFLHKSLKVASYEPIWNGIAANETRACWQGLLSKMWPVHLAWSWEAAVEGLNEIEQRCCALSSPAGISPKTAWAQTCLLQVLSWSCQY